MKRKILLFISMMALLICMFAIMTNAQALPDADGETFTLADGTVLPIWDENGNGLIWYKSTVNADDGYANYDYVHNNQTDSSQAPYITHGLWTGTSYGGAAYQTGEIKITDANGTTVSSKWSSSPIVLANLKGAKYDTNNLFNTLNSTFRENSSLEGCYLDPCTRVLVGWVFYKNSSLRYINLGETGVVAIGDQANFAECTKLTNIELPSTLYHVGRWQFQNTGITSIHLPSSITAWGDTNFKNCYSLETVTGYESLFERGVVSTISENTFLNCSKLTTVFESGVFPSNITSVGNYAFQNCASLTDTVTLSSGLTTIGNFAFAGCKAITSVTISAGFTSIGSKAFQDCINISSLVFAGDAGANAVINEAAFERCYLLGNVAIPEGVTTLGNCAFNHAGISNLSLPSTLTTITGNSHFNLSGSKATTKIFLQTVTGLENTKITTIPNSMFRSQSGEWNKDNGGIIKLPNTVTSIGQYGFADCGAKIIILGEGLTTIGTEAFVNCPRVEKFYLPDTLTSITANAFNNNKRSNIFFFVTSNDADYITTVKTGTLATTNAEVDYATYIQDTTIYTSGRYVIYNVSKCVAFYDSVHIDEVVDLSYPDGFENEGICTSNCARCGDTTYSIVDRLIYSIGYAQDPNTSSRITISSGYIVDTDLVDIYNRLNGVNLEIGILFAGAELISTEKPTSLEGLHYFSNQGNNFYSSYDYVISFPGKTDETYSKYANAEFVASCFIYDGTSYYFYQGLAEGNEVTNLESGFVTTNLYQVLGEEPEDETCTDDPNSHTYGSFSVTTPGTCTTAAVGTKTCTLCGFTQTITDESIKGHVWGEWKDSSFLTVERSCLTSDCGATQTATYTNITTSILDSATLTSTAYGVVGTAYDGNWNDTSIATRNPNDDVVVTYELKSSSQFDRVYVKGHGSARAKFTVDVMYEGDGDYTTIGTGKFLSSGDDDATGLYVPVDSSKNILAVKVTISNGSYGMDYLSEIGLTKLSGTGIDVTNETVTITYDADPGYFENNFDYSKYVTTNDSTNSHPTPVHSNPDMEFVGWYLDAEYTIPVTANTTFSENATLYSKWVFSSVCTSPSGEHTCEEWTTVTPATCATKGEKSATCVTCGKTVIASIEKTEHTPVTVEGVEANCTTAGVTESVECSVCGEHISGGELIMPNDNHVCANLTVVVTPTKYVKGSSTGTCDLCGTSFTQEMPFSATQDDLSSVDVGVNYTGGTYSNETFVNVAPLGRVYATSYFAGTKAGYIIDKDYATFWNADTYVDGANYTSDYIEIELPFSYDIGVIALTIPNYSSYDLGDDCYVSYNVEYWDDATDRWVYIGTVSDKNATSLGANCLAQLTLDTPITTQKIRASVTHASRYAPAVIYELEAYGKANSFDYDIQNIAPNANVSISGKYNDWADGAESLTDGDLDTYWFTDIRNGGPTWALLEFDKDTYVASVQIAIKTSSSRTFKLEVYENGEWVQIGDVYTANGVVGGNIISNANGISTFNIDIEKDISQVKMTLFSDPGYWESYVYEISVYSVTAKVNDEATTECKHTNLTQNRVVAATCVETGYTVMSCASCGAEVKTNATDILTHSFGEYQIETPATATSIGTKVSSCTNCDATVTVTYEESYESPIVTPYRHNAPAAWAQTFDDGNYSETYDWVIPQLEKYGYRATALLSISFASTHTDAWLERLESGVFDIGSHSYNHRSIYHDQVSATDLLDDVVNAQYWLRNTFKGQKVITFAAPNGATSDDVANYLTGMFVANRNGGQGYAFYNVLSDLENGRSTWGNLNSYISKADQTEGDYIFTNADGSIVYTLDENNNYVLNESYANTGINYVFDESENTFVNKGYSFGTYYYVAEDYRYDFLETGSYNLVDGEFVFVNDNSGEYRLVKATIGSYESGIDTLVANGAFTVECLHSLLESRYAISGTIHSSYVSTVSKFEYLAKRGVWAPSYTDLALYLKEAQNAKVETVSRTDDALTINVTDNLDNYMFDYAVTVKVDISDSWKSVVVTQNGVEIPLVDIEEYRASKNMSTISCAIDNGYLYVDIIPDGGEVVITANAKITETENGGAQVGTDIKDILG